jgi:omega-3 fatty acid desaturase (delta-15 desaturase)
VQLEERLRLRSEGAPPVPQAFTDSGLPFSLQDLKNAIPEECFQPSAWRSIAYFLRDVGLVVALYVVAYRLDTWWFYPLFWVMQGTLFWALFVVGHDCGHGSFSKWTWLNNLVGHLCHTPILVPYHGWRISHRTHHANTGNIDTDESWYPLSESQYRNLPAAQRLVRFYASLLAYPLYLFLRSPGRKGSHFLPTSPLFRRSERLSVMISTLCCVAMVTLLLGLTVQFGVGLMVKFYLMPYLVFVVWLDLVTLLHHTTPDIPWYRGKDWTFLKGALSTIDRDYGVFNSIHHHIGTHVAHHIFLGIPHYHLETATAAIKPMLGDYYRQSRESLWASFCKAFWQCHYVPDHGSQVYYQPHPRYRG